MNPATNTYSTATPTVYSGALVRLAEQPREPGKAGQHHHRAEPVVGPRPPRREAAADQRRADQQRQVRARLGGPIGAGVSRQPGRARRRRQSPPPRAGTASPSCWDGIVASIGHRGQSRCGSGRGPGASATPPSRVSPSRLARGSQASQLGRYQLRSPSSFIVAGSSTPRTTVASIRTATASPTPASLRSSELGGAEQREHADHHQRGGADHAGGPGDPVAQRVLGAHPRVDALPDAAEDEHVVVHRQPEQDHEQEQRQPRDDRAVGAEPEQRPGPSGAGTRARARRRTRRPTAG